MPGRLSRRDMLKTGAIVTAAAGELLARPEPASARPLEADVIVVGAGYAGMGAAWELFKRGQRVLVLEANDRIGGRVWSSKLSDGTLFEIGGQWVSDAQTDIRTLMAELGVADKIYLTADKGLNVFVNAEGKVGFYDENDLDPFKALPPLSDTARDFATIPGPGVLTGVGFGPAIRAPFGRIHWAGIDTATAQYCSFSSAVQSGKRAAAEVLAAG